MRPGIFPNLLAFFLLATFLRAEDLITLDGTIYTNAVVKRTEPDGIVIAHADGIAKLKFKHLSRDICAKYGYDEEAEKKYLEEKKPAASPAPQSSPSASVEIPLESAGLDRSTMTPTHVNWENILKAWDWALDWISRIYHRFFPAEPSQTVTPSPSPLPNASAQIDQILGKSPIPSEELASLITRFPNSTVAKLESQRILLAGTVENISADLNQERAEILLKGSPERHIRICMDVSQRHDSATLSGKSHWEIIDHKLFLGSSPTPLCQVGSTLTKHVRLLRAGSSSVYFLAED
jgi:hypothetical protein